ncbi:MAG: hypothetical protein V4621_08180 [Pseudomonadota bacterium]
MELLAHPLFFVLRLLMLAVVFGTALLTLDNFRPGSLAYLKARIRLAVIKARVWARCLFLKHSGAVIVIIGLAAWGAYGPLAKQIGGDGPDGPALMDIGVFQTILLAIIRAVAVYCFTRLLVKKYVAPVGRFLYGRRFVWAFYRLTAWQKIIASLWVLSVFVFLVTQLTH